MAPLYTFSIHAYHFNLVVDDLHPVSCFPVPRVMSALNGSISRVVYDYPLSDHIKIGSVYKQQSEQRNNPLG